MLVQVTGQHFAATDFNDNRLGALLQRLSKTPFRARFEAALWEHSVAVYAVCPAMRGCVARTSRARPPAVFTRDGPVESGSADTAKTLGLISRS